MTMVTLALDRDDPVVTQDLTAAVAVALREEGYTVHPARPDPDADQAMGGSLLEIGQRSSHLGGPAPRTPGCAATAPTASTLSG